MKKENIIDFRNGAIIGMTQTLMGYPLDTIKTLKQNNQNIKITKTKEFNNGFNKIKILRLYQGVSYPLYLSIGFNSGVFGLYSIFLKEGMSHQTSGFLAGGIMGIISNPFEYYKVNSQVGNTFKYKNIWKGGNYTFWRESIAHSFYFSSYHYFTEYRNLSPFLAGGISGCLSWTVTYPIDTIKTIKQSNNNLNIGDIIKMVKKREIKIWNGFFTCQCRAFIVNGVSFVMYDYFKNKSSHLQN